MAFYTRWRPSRTTGRGLVQCTGVVRFLAIIYLASVVLCATAFVLLGILWVVTLWRSDEFRYQPVEVGQQNVRLYVLELITGKGRIGAVSSRESQPRYVGPEDAPYIAPPLWEHRSGPPVGNQHFAARFNRPPALGGLQAGKTHNGSFAVVPIWLLMVFLAIHPTRFAVSWHQEHKRVAEAGSTEIERK